MLVGREIRSNPTRLAGEAVLMSHDVVKKLIPFLSTGASFTTDESYVDFLAHNAKVKAVGHTGEIHFFIGKPYSPLGGGSSHF